MKDIIVIVGPTGIGKTKLSIELAKRLDAEIINGDSVSIYRDLDIGSDKPTILFLDDIVGTNILYESDMKKIKLRYEKDVKNDFNIMFCFGGTCAETLIEEFVRKDIHIDYALLDITIKTIFKIDCDTAMEVDGVDLALLLMKYNHDIKILFATGHTLNKYNKTMQEYINKFEFGTGENILDHYLNKNATDRVTPIYKLLYEGTGDEHRN